MGRGAKRQGGKVLNGVSTFLLLLVVLSGGASLFLDWWSVRLATIRTRIGVFYFKVSVGDIENILSHVPLLRPIFHQEDDIGFYYVRWTTLCGIPFLNSIPLLGSWLTHTCGYIRGALGCTVATMFFGVIAALVGLVRFFSMDLLRSSGWLLGMQLFFDCSCMLTAIAAWGLGWLMSDQAMQWRFSQGGFIAICIAAVLAFINLVAKLLVGCHGMDDDDDDDGSWRHRQRRGPPRPHTAAAPGRVGAPGGAPIGAPSAPVAAQWPQGTVLYPLPVGPLYARTHVPTQQVPYCAPLGPRWHPYYPSSTE